MTDDTSQTIISVGDGKLIHKIRRVRQMTDAEFYRPMSRLYDKVIDQHSQQHRRSVGWVMLSTGASHIVTCILTEIPDRGPITGKQLTILYFVISCLLSLAGIVLLVWNYTAHSTKSAEKEKLLDQIIEAEFTNDWNNMGSAPSIAQASVDIPQQSNHIHPHNH